VTITRRRASLTVSNAVVGIDLGTSNTAMACVFDGTARVLRVQDSASVPSLVAVAQVG
jgi:molecular chaperone DnaK (HSP70)